MIFRGQVIAQQTHTGQVDLSRVKQAKNGWKSPREPRRRDAMERFTLAQTEPTTAIVEQRRAAPLEVQPPLLHRREMGDDSRLGARATQQQPLQLALQITIFDTTQLPEFPVAHPPKTNTRFFVPPSCATKRFLSSI